MDISTVAGTDAERTTGWFVSFHEQWSSLFGRGYNWYDFTFVRVYVEYAPYSDRWEVEVVLLGLGVNIQYVYSDRFAKEMEARMREADFLPFKPDA